MISQRTKACWRYAWPLGIVALIPTGIIVGVSVFFVPIWAVASIGILAFMGLAFKFVKIQVAEFERIESVGQLVAPVVFSAKDTPRELLVIEEAAWLSLFEDSILIQSDRQALQIPYAEMNAIHSERRALRRIWTIASSRCAVLEICCRDASIMTKLKTSAGCQPEEPHLENSSFCRNLHGMYGYRQHQGLGAQVGISARHADR